MVSQSLRIAWFSDLARGRAESLSAYCSRLLLPELSTRHDIEVFSESFSTSEFGLPHHHYLNAYRRHRDKPFDVFFYQLEDSRACRFIRGHIGLMPGVVWVHDLFCNDLGPEACHTSPWEHTIKQFYDPSLPFAERSVAPHQLWPRVYREASLCPVVLFSSQWARDEFSRMTSNRLEASLGSHYADVLPVPVDESLARSDSSAQRRETLRIACANVTGLEGRMHKVLPTLRQVSGQWSLTWMLDSHEVEAARALVHEFGIDEARIRCTSPRSPETWASIVRESDLALHLHVSTFGHLAPYTQLSMALRCPVVVARAAQGEDLPENVAFHIIPGMHEAAQLQGVIEAIQARAGMALGLEGFRYALARGEVASVASRLSEYLRSSASALSAVMKGWAELGARAEAALCEEVKMLVGSRHDGAEADGFQHVIEPSLRELGWG